MNNSIIFVRVATKADAKYADEIVAETQSSALLRGSGISKRTPASIVEKMIAGKAVIAVTAGGEWAGFSYFESWQNNAFISNSGLIVAPKFRKSGVAKSIKNRIFSLSRRLYPNAKIFSITSGAAIMKMNTQLGFEPVTFAQITQDTAFWESCKSCVNYSILESKNKSNCLCTAMLFSPEHIDQIIASAENTLQLQQNLNLKSI
ncbi:N-acetyltransferase [Pedobacter sp. HDW13]|uniref:N-acetyltransferase n=1 Tax=unclassified Pedobacter TaxID=2628915 RepID=UPI000F5B642E|nr:MULTISPECIES: N-acetyltransferase [unclassified Pedobacter]QIL40326.1 N-acetyltransferase [Pedobacter sp. HDW13]RQO79413.1 N-acetyltransferase [Pedobacter sp. KBW01]